MPAIRTPPKTSNAKRVKSGVSKSTKRKPRAGNNGTALVVPRPYPIPLLLHNYHKYTDRVTVTTSGIGLGSYLFSANGLYDPDISGTGHQPLYFDQLTNLYDHYRVMSSKIRWTICNPTSSAQNSRWSAHIDDDALIGSGTTGVYPDAERPGVTAKSMMWNATQPLVLTNYWNAKKAFGAQELGDSIQQGTSGSNPAEQQYFSLFVSVDTAVVATYLVEVEVEYFVEWSEFATVTAS